MNKAYVATGEHAQMICANHKNPSKALNKIGKLIEKLCFDDQNMMLSAINVGYDDDGYYNITAIVSTTL
jgi:hypothetical protein